MLSSFSIVLLAGYAAWGLSVGLVVGFTAIGTGLLGTPGLIVLFGLDPVVAVGTMSVAGIIMMGSGAVAHYREGNVCFPVALLFLITAVPVSYVTARFARAINEIISLNVVVGFVILVSVVLLFYRYMIMQPHPRELEVKLIHLVVTPFLGLALGLLIGATSISGSIILIAFILLLQLPTPHAVGTTTVVSTISLLIASIAHLQSGNIDWSVLLGLVPGVFLGSFTGARFVNRVPRHVLRFAILVILFAAGIVVLVR